MHDSGPSATSVDSPLPDPATRRGNSATQATGLRLPIEIINMVIDWCLSLQFDELVETASYSWPNYIHDTIGLALVHPEIARSMKRRVRTHACRVYLHSSICPARRTDGTQDVVWIGGFYPKWFSPWAEPLTKSRLIITQAPFVGQSLESYLIHFAYNAAIRESFGPRLERLRADRSILKGTEWEIAIGEICLLVKREFHRAKRSFCRNS